MKMKLFLGLAAAVFLLSACNNDDENIGNWSESRFFSGIPRDGQVHFTIGDVAYVGFGVNTTADEEDDDDDTKYGDFITEDGVFSDLWKFEGGDWTQVASLVQSPDLAGMDNRTVARRNAVAFASDEYGYVGTGQTYSPQTSWEEVSDFYKYDPTADAWTKIGDYPGGKRSNAFAFTIGDYGYVGCGSNSRTTNDFHRFNMTTGEWDATKYTFGGEKREGAQVFVLNDFAYVVSGRNNGADLLDVWKFDPTKLGTEDAWVKQIDLDNSDYDFENVRRSYGVAWSFNGRGYVATGTRNGSSLSDVWEFNPSNQEWEEKQDFEGRARRKAAAFVLDNVIYLGGGGTSNANAYDDFWTFDPFAEYDAEF